MQTLQNPGLLDSKSRDSSVNEAKWRLAAIVESSNDAIISKDLNGVINTWNEGATRLFGYAAEEIIGRSITTIIPSDRQHEELEILRRIRNGERIDHYQTVRRRKDGSLVDVSLTVSPIQDETGRVIGASKIARDIRDLKAYEKALKAAKEEAEAINALKDRFLAMLSHELRTPLTPALIAAAALETESSLPSPIRSEIAMIRRSIELVAKLIDDLLDLSRIKSGKLNLHIEPIDLNHIVRLTCDICDPQIQEKNIHLVRDLDPDAGWVMADSTRLQQVLWNILKNAAKFTPEGGNILVKTRRSEKTWRVEIHDTGIGIEPHLFPRLFTAFEQGNSNDGNYSGGLGLGLAISKTLVELHGGTIRAESAGAGKGSIFIVEVPEQSPVESAHKATFQDEASPSAPIRILLVEDHPDTARILHRLLERGGYAVETANDVAGALALAASTRFDVLVSDLGLPDASGVELMQRLRSQSAIKGIAMTGYGMEEDLRESRLAGFEEHLVKPVDLPQLQRAIARVLNRQ